MSSTSAAELPFFDFSVDQTPDDPADELNQHALAHLCSEVATFVGEDWTAAVLLAVPILDDSGTEDSFFAGWATDASSEGAILPFPIRTSTAKCLHDAVVAFVKTAIASGAVRTEQAVTVVIRVSRDTSKADDAEIDGNIFTIESEASPVFDPAFAANVIAIDVDAALGTEQGDA